MLQVLLGKAFPPVPAVAEGEKPEEAKPEGENAEGEPAPKPPVEWRELCIEKLQAGFAIPPRPQPPTR